MSAVAGTLIQELAGLLARGYVRLLTARRQNPDIAQNPAAQESPTVLRIGVDVAAGKMAQLDRDQRR